MFVCFMLNAVWVNGLRNCLLLRAHRQDAVRNAQRSEPCSTAVELNLAGAVPVKLHRKCADNHLLPLELTACSEAEERWGLWMPDLARRSAGQPERLPALCLLQPSQRRARGTSLGTAGLCSPSCSLMVTRPDGTFTGHPWAAPASHGGEPRTAWGAHGCAGGTTWEEQVAEPAQH